MERIKDISRPLVPKTLTGSDLLKFSYIIVVGDNDFKVLFIKTLLLESILCKFLNICEGIGLVFNEPIFPSALLLATLSKDCAALFKKRTNIEV